MVDSSLKGLEHYILQMAHYLRLAGVDATLAEVQDCLKGLHLVGLEREPFYLTLRSCLVKRQRDWPVFERLFRHLFGSARLPETEGRAATGEAQRAEIAEGRGQQPDGQGGVTVSLLQAVRQPQQVRTEQLVAQAVDSIGELKQEYLENVEDAVQRAQVWLRWHMAVDQLERETDDQPDVLNDYHRQLDEIALALRLEVERRLRQLYGDEALAELMRQEDQDERDFGWLNHQQVAAIQRQIVTLARSMATRKSRRYRAGGRTQVDMRRTLQQAAAYAGVPVELRYRHRVPRKPELVLLCDVSGSVARYSNFMLQMVYAWQQSWRHVSSFVFVDDIAEVTGHFKLKDPVAAAREVAYMRGITRTGFSDFGRVFTIFRDQFGQSVSPRTTLVILGDARNNWRPAQAEALGDICSRAHRTLWFNPQPREQWYAGDSCLAAYQCYCQRLVEVRNLDQLRRAVRMLM